MLPESIPTVTLTARFLSPAGQPLAGTVTVRAPAQITFPAADLILGGPVVAQLDAQGQIEMTLPATDAPGMDPAGWSYTVTESLSGIPTGRTYQLLLPRAQPRVDLADAAPTDPSKPNYVPVIGPPGDRGERGQSAYEVAVAAGFSGTPADWLASLVGPRGTTGPQGAVGPVGPAGPPGVVQKVNGISVAEITLTAAQIGAVPAAAAGAAGGIATLGADGRVPAVQLPPTSGAGTVESVNDRTGRVVLDAAAVGAASAAHTHTAAQVGALAATARGGANGVAALDASSRLPVAQLPTGVLRNAWTPQALGFQAWSCDPAHVSNPTTVKAATVQRLYLSGIHITEPTQVNAVVMFARGWAGSGTVPAARFYAGIYTEQGSRIATSGLVSNLPAAGQLPGTAVGARNNHIGAVPVPLTATSTLQPGRYWAAFLLSAGSATDFYYMHLQNESPSAPANFFLGSTFQRAWCLNSQTSLPNSVDQATGEVGLDPAIMALAMV